MKSFNYIVFLLVSFLLLSCTTMSDQQRSMNNETNSNDRDLFYKY